MEYVVAAIAIVLLLAVVQGIQNNRKEKRMAEAIRQGSKRE